MVTVLVLMRLESELVMLSWEGLRPSRLLEGMYVWRTMVTLERGVWRSEKLSRRMVSTGEEQRSERANAWWAASICFS